MPNDDGANAIVVRHTCQTTEGLPQRLSLARVESGNSCRLVGKFRQLTLWDSKCASSFFDLQLGITTVKLTNHRS